MKGYGQFCPLALATEIVGERWSLLVLRELMLGSRRFNDLQRGVPRMSPSLLAQRLKTLARTGIVERRVEKSGTEYVLTEAGMELLPAVEALAVWGKTWLPATLSDDNSDPDFLMWDLHRRMDIARLPEDRTVILFDFEDQPKAKRHRWIVADVTEVGLCITDPGYEVDLYVTTDSRTMSWIWYGDIPLKRALSSGSIRLDGPPKLCAAFPSWLLLNELAGLGRRTPLLAAE